jgi:hypothetical protein
MDMHSGGSLKEKWQYIYIEAKEDDAKTIFYNRFGHNPERVTCTCCGEDYSISESKTFEQAAGHDMGWHFDEKKDKYINKPSKGRFSFTDYMTAKEYRKSKDILVIPSKQIKKSERGGAIPEQGYVWVD